MALVAISVALRISAFHRVLGIFAENVSCCFFVYIYIFSFSLSIYIHKVVMNLMLQKAVPMIILVS